MTQLVATKGRMTTIAGRRVSPNGQATHLTTASGDKTLCGLDRWVAVPHICPIRQIVSCRVCTKRADREYPTWRTSMDNSTPACGTDQCSKPAEYKAGYDGDTHAIYFCDDHMMVELSAHYAGMLERPGERIWVEHLGR